MALLDQAREAAFGLVKQKLVRGRAADLLNRGEPILRRIVNLSGNGGPFVPKGTPGARDPLNAAKARMDPLMSYNWFCDLPTLDGVALSWEFVEEATLPFVEFEQVSNYRAGKMYHYPHQHNIGTLSLKLYEDSAGTATQYVEQWRRKILDLDSGLYFHPADFKRTITVTVLDVSKLTVMFLEYTGCWPMRSDAFALNSGSSDRVAPSVEFSVDEMRVKFGQFQQDQVPSIINHIGVDWPPKLSMLPLKFPGNFADFTMGDLFQGGAIRF